MGTYTCIHCGRTYERKRQKPSGLCNVCGFEQMQEEIRQLQEKAGPHYERWKIGQERWKRERAASARSLHAKR